VQVEIEKSDNSVCVVDVPIEVQHTQEMILNMVYNCGALSVKDIIRLDGKKFEIRAFGFKEVG